VSDAQADYIALPVYRDELGAALGFTPPDLEANRQGRLGQSQEATWFRLFFRSAAKSGISLLVAIGALALAFSGGIAGVLGVTLLIVAATFLAFIGINAWYMLPAWRDVNAGVVSTVEGLVRPAERETRIPMGSGLSTVMWSYYWVVDGQQRFWVPGKAYPLLIPARHRIYFLPSSRRIVAAEPITGTTSQAGG
jgi:hypothetical protein